MINKKCRDFSQFFCNLNGLVKRGLQLTAITIRLEKLLFPPECGNFDLLLSLFVGVLFHFFLFFLNDTSQCQKFSPRKFISVYIFCIWQTCMFLVKVMVMSQRWKTLSQTLLQLSAWLLETEYNMHHVFTYDYSFMRKYFYIS